jgi:hypothetical protein
MISELTSPRLTGGRGVILPLWLPGCRIRYLWAGSAAGTGLSLPSTLRNSQRGLSPRRSPRGGRRGSRSSDSNGEKTTIFTGTDVRSADGAAAGESGSILAPPRTGSRLWVDVFVGDRGEPGDVLLIHRPAFGSRLVERVDLIQLAVWRVRPRMRGLLCTQLHPTPISVLTRSGRTRGSNWWRLDGRNKRDRCLRGLDLVRE